MNKEMGGNNEDQNNRKMRTIFIST